MGTVFSFDVRTEDEPSALAALESAVRWLHRVDEVFSTFRPDSQISRLGRGELELSQCDPDVAEVLRLCEDAERRSRGWFTATYAGRLDPTGLVKGWAVERAAQLFVDAGVDGACINGGGDVQARGRPMAGRPWRVGVSDPMHVGNLAAVVEGFDRFAVATSGPAERGCHIVDPFTREPSGSPLASITVIAPGLTEADAWATAAFAMGDSARDWLDDMPNVEALAIAADGRNWRTTGFARYSTTSRSR